VIWAGKVATQNSSHLFTHDCIQAGAWPRRAHGLPAKILAVGHRHRTA